MLYINIELGKLLQRILIKDGPAFKLNQHVSQV